MYTIYKFDFCTNIYPTLTTHKVHQLTLYWEYFQAWDVSVSHNSAKWHLQNLNYWCLFHAGNFLCPKYLSQYSTLSTHQFSALFAFSIDFEPCFNLLHINVVYHVSLDTLQLDKGWHCHCILSMSSKYI